MAESTATLQTLRRALGLELKMPFFRRFTAGYLEMDSGSSTTKIVDSALTQKDGFWNGSWSYLPATKEVSLIRSFQANDNTLHLEVPMASSPSVGDDFEIHEGWNALDMRHAINQAILEGGRTWAESVTDESLILQEDKLSYDLTGLTRRVWIMAHVLVENRATVYRGVAASATTNTLTVENASILSGVTTASTWRISIYAGTGKGQLRTLSGTSGAQVTVTSNWTTTPDTTSKYCLWNTAEEVNPWIPLDSLRLDSKEYPDTLEFFKRKDSLYGLRIRLEYLSEPLKLTEETDTTTIPERWIIPYAVHLLMGQRISDTKSDRETFLNESERYRIMAEDFRTKNAPHKADITLKSQHPMYNYIPDQDPLGWKQRW